MKNTVIAINILHYKDYHVTSRCIDSLLALQVPLNCQAKIVVIDNGSLNNSLEELKRRYSSQPLTFIESQQNLGFAKGNNLGFDYAKEVLNADIAIFLNNDIEIKQPDFLKKTIDCLQKNNIDVLCPDVYVPQTNWHQSPLCDGKDMPEYITGIVEKSRSILAKSMNYTLLEKAKKTISNLLINFPPYMDYLIKKNTANIVSSDWEYSRSNIVPQGACVIVNKHFIQNMQYIFHPGTFMYFEECILKVMCDSNNFQTYYCHNIQVLHHHGCITKESIKKQSKLASRRVAKQTLESYEILKDLQDTI